MKKRTLAPEEEQRLTEIVEALTGETLEEFRTRVRNAVKASNIAELQTVDEYGPWVEDIILEPTAVIVEVPQAEALTKWYRVAFVDDNGTIVFGEPVQVQRLTLWAPIPAAESSSSREAAEGAGEPQVVEVSESGDPERAEVTEAAAPTAVEQWRANDYKSGPITLIRQGWNSRGTRFYTGAAMESGAVFEGAQMFANHQTKADAASRPEGDVQQLVGIVRGPAVAESGGAVVGNANILQPSWREFLKAADEVGELPALALSVNANVMERSGSVDGRKGKVVESFIGPAQGGKHPRVDFVTIAGAGGRLAEAAEAWANAHTQEGTEMEWKDITLADLKKERGDLIEALRSEVKESVYGDKDAVQQLRDEVEDLKAENLTLKTAQDQRHKAEVLEAAVAETELPEQFQALITESAEGREFDSDEAVREWVKARAEKHRAALSEVSESGRIKDFGGGDGEATEETKEQKLARTKATFGR